MSTHGLFRVRDLVMDMFSGPLLMAHNKAAAQRLFADAVNDANSDLGKHPADYELYMLGLIEDETGKIKVFDVPERVCRATDVMREVVDAPKLRM